MGGGWSCGLDDWDGYKWGVCGHAWSWCYKRCCMHWRRGKMLVVKVDRVEANIIGAEMLENDVEAFGKLD